MAAAVELATTGDLAGVFWGSERLSQAPEAVAFAGTWRLLGRLVSGSVRLRHVNCACRLNLRMEFAVSGSLCQAEGQRLETSPGGN